MHYADGQEAKLGDLVRGQPYSEDHEITGVVVELRPGSDSCNVDVAYAVAPRNAWSTNVVRVGSGGQLVQLDTSAGETKAFQLIRRAPEAKA